MRRASRALRGCALASILLVAGGAAAQSPKPAKGASESLSEAERLKKAKALFHEGNALRKAGAYERALDYYERSRELVPSTANTLNAAVCLGKLGRYDEALDVYEVVLTKFGKDLNRRERRFVAAEMKRHNGQVGSVNVVANVEGKLVIDGRPRGTLPLRSPVRLVPGKHDVVVLADGFRSVESTVKITVKKTETLTVKLEPLAESGRLRLAQDALAGADVFIDGSKVGVMPWEGALEPGPHVLQVIRGDEGSRPVEVVVVKGQTALMKVETAALGPPVRMKASPDSARIAIGGVALRASRWSGRLPLGTIPVVATEEGYVALERDLEVKPGMEAAITLELAVDEDHPRWGSTSLGTFFAAAQGAFAFVPGMAGSAEASCDGGACPGASLGLGGGGRITLGYAFDFGLAVGVTGGYTRVGVEVERSVNESFPAAGATVDTRYDLQDDVLMAGPLAGLHVEFRQVVAEPLELRAGVAAAAVFTRSTVTISGQASAGGNAVPVSVANNGNPVTAVNLLVQPEVGIGVRLGKVGIAAGFAAGVFVLEGPETGNGDIRPRGDACATNAQAIECAPGEAFATTERAHGTFFTLQPTLGIDYLF